VVFQCSSASRKFLNTAMSPLTPVVRGSFSALQRAENSSIGQHAPAAHSVIVSVLFSEPKIPQSDCTSSQYVLGCTFQCSSASRKFLNARNRRSDRDRYTVSVLFSEPKIPQCDEALLVVLSRLAFQCSSASRKFLNRTGRLKRSAGDTVFQCSSASRKFLNLRKRGLRGC